MGLSTHSRLPPLSVALISSWYLGSIGPRGLPGHGEHVVPPRTLPACLKWLGSDTGAWFFRALVV